MKKLYLAGLLLSVLGGACTALRPPSAVQLTAAQAAFSPTPPTVHPGIHDSPAVRKQGMPLVFVNGQKYSAAKLRRLEPGTVDSAYILMPPVSTALYKRRGRNGVVIYTSKKYR
jgi:hypothetical protein